MPENKSDKLDDEIKSFFEEFVPMGAIHLKKNLTAEELESALDELTSKIGETDSKSDECEDGERVLDTSGYEEGLKFLKTVNAIAEKYADSFDGNIASNESLYSIPQGMIEKFPKVLRNVLAYEVYLDVH